MTRSSAFIIPAAILGLWAVITAAYLFGAFVLAWAVLIGTMSVFVYLLIGLERSADRKHDMESMCYLLVVMLVSTSALV